MKNILLKETRKIQRLSIEYVNGKIKGRGAIPDLKMENGSVVNQDTEKADAFNSIFSSVFTMEDTLHLPDISCRSFRKELADVTFITADVLKHLLNLKTDKSPGEVK